MNNNHQIIENLSKAKALVRSGNGENNTTMAEVSTLLNTIHYQLNQNLIESKAVKKSDNELYLHIFEKAPVGILHYDENGVITACNNKFISIFGSSQKKLNGLKLTYLPNTRLVKAIKKSLNGEKTTFEDKYTNRTTGQTVAVRAIFYPLYNPDKKSNGGIGMIEDITERFTAQTKLVKAEQQFRKIVEHTNNMLYTHDTDGVLTYVSPQSMEFLGVDSEQALQHWTNFISDHPANENTKYYTKRAIETGEVQPAYELQLRKKDDTLIWVEANEAPIVKDGKTVEIVGSLTNITERKKAEHQSEKHLKLLEKLTEQTSAAVWIRDNERRYIFANKEYKSIFGVRDKSVTGKTVYEIFEKDTAQQFNDNDLRVLNFDKANIFENWAKTDTGERYYRINMFPISGIPGLDQAVGGIAIDITEQKQREEVIGKSLKEKEALISEIHHRVKNNLAVISALLELNLFQSQNEQTTEFIRSSLLRIKAMANAQELLYQSDSFSDISFKKYIDWLLKTIKLALHNNEHGPIFKTNIEDVSLNINQAVPCGLILNELITNCLKHAFEDIENGIVEVSFTIFNDEITLLVEDNGVGMPGEFSLEDSPSLGMTLVDILSQQLEGELSIENKEKGCRCSLVFTRRDKAHGISNRFM